MKTSVIAWVSLSFFCAVSSTIQAQLRERRSSPTPAYEITVTLKLDWNVAALGKPIPPSYTTKVPNGTVLLDIMNKAADDDRQGPFNKYESTYYGGLGYLVTTINGTEHNHATKYYWYKHDEQTGVSLPCGANSYVPHNGSTTLFKFTGVPAGSSHNNTASGYCISATPAGQVPPSAITVTIALDWNENVVGKSVPSPYTTKVDNGTPLKEVINKAADENTKGPFNKYTSSYFGGQGHFITSMNGIKQDFKTDSYWMIYDKGTGKLSKPYVDQYKPQDGSTTILKLITATTHGPEPNSSGKFVGMGLVVLCLVATVEGLLLWLL